MSTQLASPQVTKLEVAMPQSGLLVAEAQKALELVSAITIDSPLMFEEASKELIDIKSAGKALDDRRKSMVDPLNKVVKDINDLFRQPIAIHAQAEALLKRAMVNFQQDEERKRRDEQRRLDEAARQERNRLEQEAAAERARAAALAEEQRTQAAQAESEGRKDDAARLQVAADQTVATAAERVEELTAVAEVITAPVVSTETPKVRGISTRENWTYEVTDFEAVVKAVAEGKAPLSLLMLNEKVCGQQAKSLKREFVVPGLRVYPESVMAARRIA